MEDLVEVVLGHRGAPAVVTHPRRRLVRHLRLVERRGLRVQAAQVLAHARLGDVGDGAGREARVGLGEVAGVDEPQDVAEELLVAPRLLRLLLARARLRLRVERRARPALAVGAALGAARARLRRPALRPALLRRQPANALALLLGLDGALPPLAGRPLGRRRLGDHLLPEGLEMALHHQADAAEDLDVARRLAAPRQPPERHRLGDGDKLEAARDVGRQLVEQRAPVAGVDHVVVLALDRRTLVRRAGDDGLEAVDHVRAERVEPPEVARGAHLGAHVARLEAGGARVEAHAEGGRSRGRARRGALRPAGCDLGAVRAQARRDLAGERPVVVVDGVEEVRGGAHLGRLPQPPEEAASPAVRLGRPHLLWRWSPLARWAPIDDLLPTIARYLPQQPTWQG
mmetsp:Transcript_47531/g.153616  ORF Transcript_47531/g.153616 Transcript_47531/m.153616 type:complete len:400 (-) Transcript_47531:242-1441(-)